MAVRLGVQWAVCPRSAPSPGALDAAPDPGAQRARSPHGFSHPRQHERAEKDGSISEIPGKYQRSVPKLTYDFPREEEHDRPIRAQRLSYSRDGACAVSALMVRSSAGSTTSWCSARDCRGGVLNRHGLPCPRGALPGPRFSCCHPDPQLWYYCPLAGTSVYGSASPAPC